MTLTLHTLIFFTLVFIALSCYLAVKFHNADKAADRLSHISDYIKPVTKKNLIEALEANGFTILQEQDDNILPFRKNDLVYSVHLKRNPILFVSVGWQISEDIDRECLKRALDKAKEEVVMITYLMSESNYDFLLAAVNQTMGEFMANLSCYLYILDDAIKCMSGHYNQYLNEKRERAQAMEETHNDNKILS